MYYPRGIELHKEKHIRNPQSSSPSSSLLAWLCFWALYISATCKYSRIAIMQKGNNSNKWGFYIYTYYFSYHMNNLFLFIFPVCSRSWKSSIEHFVHKSHEYIIRQLICSSPAQMMKLALEPYLLEHELNEEIGEICPFTKKNKE